MEFHFDSDSAGCDVPPPMAGLDKQRVENPSDDTIDSGPAVPDEPWRYTIRKGNEGLFVIFNQEIFDDPKMQTRTGTKADKTELQEVWKNLGFKVSTHDDLTLAEIRAEIKKYSERNYHSEYDCFGLAVLTHGGEKDEIYARDQTYRIHELFEPFRDCTSLVGKPKLFFIQACRGGKLDDGNKVECDAVDADFLPNEPEKNRGQVDVTIPRESDFLIAYSTVEGYYSWRSITDGSWFIRSLNKCMKNYAQKWDLMTILTQVCKDVCKKESSTNLLGFSGKKQCPSIVSRLTGLIYLTPKKEEEREVTDHPSAGSIVQETNSRVLLSESNPFREGNDVTDDDYYRIQLEILKKKKELIQLKEKLCLSKLRKVKFEI